METLCHPRLDLVAVRVVSPLVRRGRIAIRLRFPYGTGGATAADWTRPDAHETVSSAGRERARARATPRRRPLPRAARLGARGPARRKRRGTRSSSSRPRDGDALEAVGGLLPAPLAGARSPASRRRAGPRAEHWNRFWPTGGAIDLSGSRDPRWRELERRIVLSQYLTAIQCAGPLSAAGDRADLQQLGGQVPPGDALVARGALRPVGPAAAAGAEPRLLRRHPAARRGRRRGAGLRRGALAQDDRARAARSRRRASGPFLVWQQPHPIFYAELVYRRARRPRDARAVPRRRLETAEFMASFAAWDEAGAAVRARAAAPGRAGDLPQGHAPSTPTFELAYWRWGLETAQRWRERLGLAREPRWDRAGPACRRCPSRDGKYLFAETAPDSFTDPAGCTITRR